MTNQEGCCLLTVDRIVVASMLPLVEHYLRGKDHRCYATHRHDDGENDEELQLKEETLKPLLSGRSEGGYLGLLLPQAPVNSGRC